MQPKRPTSSTRAAASICFPNAALARQARDAQWLELAQRARRGDTASFETLYECSAPWLLRSMRRLLGPHDAEDAVSEAYFQAWRELDRFDALRASVAGWLMLIASSRALDLLRRHQRRHAFETASAAEDVDQFPADVEMEPERHVARNQILRLMQLQFEAVLSEDEQMVIALAYFEELSHSTISQRLKVPLGTVKSRLTRAQLKLRAAVASSHSPPLLALDERRV